MGAFGCPAPARGRGSQLLPGAFPDCESLRARASQRELGDAGMVPAADWIFHMSVADCSSLDSQAWGSVTRFVDGLSVQAAQCDVGDVEIVAFDDGQEYPGGTFELSAPAVL
jgi:hypothetical protein